MPLPYSVRDQLRRGEMAEARLEQIELERMAKPFVLDMAEGLMIILATIPRAEWPDVAKVAYRHAKTRHPGSAAAYDHIHSKGN